MSIQCQNTPKASRHLPVSDVQELLRYDPDTGVLTWKERGDRWFSSSRARASWNTRFAGKPTGSRKARGYLQVRLLGAAFYAHHLAWVLHYGEWPKQAMDHIDGCPGNNKIENLRQVTSKENRMNAAMPRNNVSGVVGVGWNKSNRNWLARIGKRTVLGAFDDFDEAVKVRKAAEVEHGYHQNHGRAV